MSGQPLWTARAIAEAVGGTATGDFAVSGVAFDSREIGPGDLFVAMRGEQADGHDYVGRALAAGAAGSLVERPVEGPHVRVADSAAALGALGAAARARATGRIIGVTGSVGKTGTKEALYLALDRQARGRVHRSVKSYNNHVGVPLSLARMPATSRFGIFEMGMNHAGELSALTRLVRPHVALVTAIAPAHIGNFANEAAIADAKAEIFEGLAPGGIGIVPADSAHVATLYNRAAMHAARVITFGFGPEADVRALDQMPARGGGSMVTARLTSGVVSFTVALPGRHWVSNALAVMAAVEALGGDVAQAGLALADMRGLPGRGRRSDVPWAGGTLRVIDESYNANPASMAATLRSLGEERPDGARVAILGAMKELGAQSDALHEALAGPIAAAALDRVLLVGEEMEPLAEALASRLPVRHVADTDAAIDAARELLSPGDVVLVKGSNSIGLSRLVAALASGES